MEPGEVEYLRTFLARIDAYRLLPAEEQAQHPIVVTSEWAAAVTRAALEASAVIEAWQAEAMKRFNEGLAGFGQEET